MLRVAAVAALGLGLFAGCEQHREGAFGVPSANEPSPNASILPAPLAAGPPKTAAHDAAHPLADSPADAGVLEPPRRIRDDDSLTADVELHAAPGISLEARFRWLEAAPPRAAEANVEAIARARDKTAFDLLLDLSSLGRLRLSFGSRVFGFPQGVELRAREDRYGHLLLWPNASGYTPVPPGTLRAALAEGRLDVTPLSEPAVTLAGSGVMLGLATQRQRVETSIGRLELEQATLAAAGAGGGLLCRFLVELVAVAPESLACKPELVPLRAEYTWGSGARFEFEVTKITRRAELAFDSLAVPPASAELRRGELPGAPFVPLIDERELADFRNRALPPPEKPDPTAPKLGLVLQNRSDEPRYFLVDGVPVVWLRPGAEWLLIGLKLGRYTLQARDFFGAESSPPRTLELPARFLVGEEPERVAR